MFTELEVTTAAHDRNFTVPGSLLPDLIVGFRHNFPHSDELTIIYGDNKPDLQPATFFHSTDDIFSDSWADSLVLEPYAMSDRDLVGFQIFNRLKSEAHIDLDLETRLSDRWTLSGHLCGPSEGPPEAPWNTILGFLEPTTLVLAVFIQYFSDSYSHGFFREFWKAGDNLLALFDAFNDGMPLMNLAST